MNRNQRKLSRDRRPQRLIREEIRRRGSRREQDGEKNSVQTPQIEEARRPAPEPEPESAAVRLDGGADYRAPEAFVPLLPDADAGTTSAALPSAEPVSCVEPVGASTVEEQAAALSGLTEEAFPDKPYIGTPRRNPAPRAGRGWSRLFPLSRRGRRVTLAAAAALLAGAFVVTLVFLPGWMAPEQASATVQGWAVEIGGRTLGVVADEAVVREMIDGLLAEYSALYGMQVNRDVGVAFRPVKIEEQYFCPLNTLKESLDRNIEPSVLAWSIYVNDRRAVTVSSQSDAVDVLMQVLSPYISDTAQDVGFVEKVTTEREYVSPSAIQSAADAVRVLTMGDGVQDNWYTVLQGDTLSKIASAFGVTVDDIRRNNPAVAETDVIHPGDQLNVALPRNWINVRYTVTESGEEVTPYKTVTVKDDSLYTSQTKVSQAGVDGLSFVVRRVFFINGLESGREVVLESVVRESVNKIVRQGTLPLPSILKQALNGLLPLPLKQGTYVISSYFGMRTLNGETRMHNGVDLAADPGTPIYASAAGTVTYAGWASGYGLVVYIDHGSGVQTRYGHCSKLLVKAGDKVKKGDKIALVGNTGDSTGPHCHFEVRVDGEAVNPLS